ETKSIPFETVYRQTDQLLVGMHQILVNGVDGEQTLIYRQIRDADDGSLIGDKVLVSEFETLKPITQIVLVGTKPLTVTTERVEVVAVDYAVERIETDQLLVGESRLERAGQKGERTLVYRDTLDNRTGLTSTVLVSDTETLAPVSERILVGTKPLTVTTERVEVVAV
ncbi:G5 domain-containing protein, partial [Cutibacterium acnes]